MAAPHCYRQTASPRSCSIGRSLDRGSSATPIHDAPGRDDHIDRPRTVTPARAKPSIVLGASGAISEPHNERLGQLFIAAANRRSGLPQSPEELSTTQDHPPGSRPVPYADLSNGPIACDLRIREGIDPDRRVDEHHRSPHRIEIAFPFHVAGKRFDTRWLHGWTEIEGSTTVSFFACSTLSWPSP